MKVLLFGTGEYYNRYKIWFHEDDVLALIDNSSQKQGTVIDGHLVIAPEDCLKYDYDEIFVLSFYITSMKKQLADIGVPEEHIHHFYELHDYLDMESVRRDIISDGYEFDKTGSNSVLLLNQDLTLGGPALALFNMALCLKRQGYEVVYGSQVDGPLHELLIKNEIPVVIDENMLVATMDECPWVYAFEKIVCNTINFHVFLSRRDPGIPVIWWLHDAAFFYEGVNKKAIREISGENLTVLAVGGISENALKQYRPDLDIRNFVYGVDDASGQVVSFVTIGYVERRKGQDILINAIRSLPGDIRKKTHFSLIGSAASSFAEAIMKEAEDIDEIEYLGLLNRDDLQKVLRSSDVMVCPSREDPMPTVCAEAMMNYLPCIVSDSTGIAGYINDYENGLTFASENAEELAERICWMVDHKTEIKQMGMEARKVYDNVFSMEVFDGNLRQIMTNVKEKGE